MYDRLSSPSTFTGVYRRAWFTDGRINHYADTMISNIPSAFEGDTNTGSNEIISDIKVYVGVTCAWVVVWLLLVVVACWVADETGLACYVVRSQVASSGPSIWQEYANLRPLSFSCE